MDHITQIVIDNRVEGGPVNIYRYDAVPDGPQANIDEMQWLNVYADLREAVRWANLYRGERDIKRGLNILTGDATDQEREDIAAYVKREGHI